MIEIIEETSALIVGKPENGGGSDAMLVTPAVVNENGSRDHRCRREAVVTLDDRLHIIGGQKLERCAGADSARVSLPM